MRVLIFGDSITQGFWDVNGGWVANIRKIYDQQAIKSQSEKVPIIFNLGVSADSSDQLLARIQPEIKARANQEIAVVIAIGVNDSRTKDGIFYTDVETYTNNLSEIYAIAKHFTSKIMFIGLTPCVESMTNPVSWGATCYNNDRIKAFNNALQNFCAQNKLPFVDIFNLFDNQKEIEKYFDDGLHPNSLGHEAISQAIQPKLQALLDD